MKVAIISYHRNISKIYPQQWVDQYTDSIIGQTYHKEFRVFELNYGGTSERIFENSDFESKELPTFIHGMNYLLDKIFSQGYDCVANSNCDDIYSTKRLEVQMPYMEQGYDLVSSNFCLVRDGKITHYHKFHELDIQQQLANEHNIIAHPSVIYSSEFWKKNRYIPEELPYEDLRLWQRAIKNSKFIIVPENLLFHRLHNQSVCQSSNR